MSIHQSAGVSSQARKGQTLAEFALTLPILLILMFGVIEFGRVFQAWVTLQNAARSAARYASTGNYDESQFVMNLNLNSATPADATGLVPCVNDGNTTGYDYAHNGDSVADPDQRGTKTLYDPPGLDMGAVEVYNGGLESLFATWNDGLNCDPYNADHQEMRRDMARILSIMLEAQRGAAGLAIQPFQFNLSGDKAQVVSGNWPWFSVWQVPNPNLSKRSYFDVSICSSRRPLNSNNSTYYSIGGQKQDTRFITYQGDNTLVTPNNLALDGGSTPPLPVPGCLLNEVQAATDTVATHNGGKPWSDPGGPADTVYITVTFNHPLITPLPLPTNYIRIQARRSAIVESFRAADPRSALAGGSAIDQLISTNTPTATSSPTVTSTATGTSTATATFTRTPTWTALPPFTCDLITATGFTISGGNIVADLHNGNSDSTFLTRVIVKWPTIRDYPQLALSDMSLSGVSHWRGRDASDVNSLTNTTDTNADPSTPANYFVSTSESDRTVASQETALWSAGFVGGPSQLQDYSTINNYGGTTFYFYNPLQPSTPCQITLNLPTPTPTPTVNNRTPSPTPTSTPTCASPQISIRFAGYQTFGIVRFDITSTRQAVAPISNFNIKWVQKGGLTLDRVTVGAPYGMPGSVLMWQASSLTEDVTPPTVGKSEGTWVQNYTIDPARAGSSVTVSVYVDFGGTSGYLTDSNFGYSSSGSEFNGTLFRIGCGQVTTTGGTGGGTWNGGEGDITVVNNNTPVPTNTAGPSNTPVPTLTPSKTFTPAPPTKTFTPSPPQPTKTNTPTPTATKPPTPIPPPTLPGGGCIDNCG